jgi:hypothetical protein
MATQLEKDRALLWRAGRISWKLHQGQKDAYTSYRSWEKTCYEARKNGQKLSGKFPRVYLADCSRRFGKDYLGILIRVEDALRKPKQMLTYATSYGKDISAIVIPLIESICEDCPSEIKPTFKRSDQGSEGGYYFANGSVIKLVGIDRNPDGLRGRYSDGISISEAGFVDNLEYALKSVIMPQLQGRLHATIMLNSTPPVNPGTWYDDVITPDCRDNGRYVCKTIMDNPLLSDAEREEFIEAAGGREAENCRREYFCERIRSVDRVVLPEFNEAVHVVAREAPEWAHGITVIDPAVRDICAVATGWWDFERNVLYFRRCWGERGANTVAVAAAIHSLEAKSFENSKFWSGREVKSNPHARFSDTEARLILDLNSLHDIKISGADKDGAEAALNNLRVALQKQQIELHPECVEMIAHLKNATWNKQRTSYERNEVYGHFDFVDVAKYAWRHANKTVNPVPPKAHLYLHNKQLMEMLWIPPKEFKSERRTVTALEAALPKKGSWRRVLR